MMRDIRLETARELAEKRKRQKALERFEQKSFLPSPIFDKIGSGKGSYVPTRFNKKALIQQVYERNAPYYSAVNIIASSLANLEIYVEYKKNGVWHDSDSHPFLDALDRGVGRIELMERFVKYLLVTGDGYAQQVLSADKTKLLGYVNLPSQYVRPIQGDRFNPIKEYEYLETRTPEYFQPHEIVRLYLPSLMHYHESLSPAVPLSEVIDLNNATIEWNKNTALSGGSPPHIAKLMNWDEEEAHRVKDAWDAQRGAKNVGSITVIPEQLTIEKFANTPHDAEWEQAVLQSMRMIFMVLNVSSSIMNDAGNKTYNNVKDSRKALYTEGVIPLAEKVYQKFNQGAKRYFRDSARIVIDRDKVEAIQEDRESLTKRVVMAVNAGLISQNEGREELGFKRKEGEEYDKLRNSSIVNNLGEDKLGGDNGNDKEVQVQMPDDGTPHNITDND